MVHSDPNFKELIDNWTDFKTDFACFLGAGASIGAKNMTGQLLPSAYDLRNLLWTRFKQYHGEDPFDPASLKLMSLEHAGAIIEAKVGRNLLSKYLQEVFTCEKPLWQHCALSHMAPNTIFTTNYDDLIELGYAHSKRHVDVICDGRAPVTGRMSLYKPHGSLSHANQAIGKGGLVLTQFDYMSMIADYRKMLSYSLDRISNSCVIIIGYSFGDMDICAELYQMRKKSDTVPWYAVFPRNDPQVRMMYAQKFNIRQIDATFESFVAALDAHINFLPTNLKYENREKLRMDGSIQ